MQITQTLELLHNVIEELSTGKLPKCEKKFFDNYNNLSKEENKEFLRILKEICMDDFYTYMAFLTYISRGSKSCAIIDEIFDLMLKADFSLIELIALKSQIFYILFENDSLYTSKQENNMYKVQKLIVHKIKNELDDKKIYIPLKNRNRKKIILMINPLLGENHSPTMRLVSLYYYLEKLGYEIIVISTSEKKIIPSTEYYLGDTYVGNSITESTQTLKINYYNLVDMTVCNIVYEKNVIDLIQGALDAVENYNPYCVIDIGGNNFLADTMGTMTTVLHMGCTSRIPVTTGNYILRYFKDGKTFTKEITQHLRKDQKIFECIYLDKFQNSVTTNTLNKNSDNFFVAIAGNRLDDEIDSDFENLLEMLIKRKKKIVFTIVGDSDRIKKKYTDSSYKNNFLFLGYVNDFQNIIGQCDLFLNPKRIGGGSGGLAAVTENVPIVTFDNCDVASTSGKRFIVHDYHEMENTVIRYIEDNEFMITQKKYCKERFCDIMKIDSKKNIEECLRKVTNELINDEMIENRK